MENNQMPAERFALEIGGKQLELTREQLLCAARLGLLAYQSEKESRGPEQSLARLTELEKRIDALETNYANRGSSMGSARTGAADSEMAELEAIYDAVFRR